MPTVFGWNIEVMPSIPAAPATIEYRTNPIVGMTSGEFNGRQQTYNWQGGFWEWSLSIGPIAEVNWPDWQGFIVALEGPSSVFQFGDPRRAVPRGVVTGLPRVLGVGVVGADLTSFGWTASTSNVLRRGDYIQVGYRLHTVKRDVNSDVDGKATIPIWPPIREPLNTGSPPIVESIITSNTQGLWRLKGNQTSIQLDDQRNYHVTLDIREAI